MMNKIIFKILFILFSDIIIYFKNNNEIKLNFNLKNSENNKELKEIEKSLTKIINYKLYQPSHIYEKVNNPKISVVITVYNGEGYLRRTLFSIQNQDFKDIEIIMIDDCSKDNIKMNIIVELYIQKLMVY